MINWPEDKQKTWCWGFIIGFFTTNAAYGIGWLLVKLLNHYFGG